MGFNCIPGLCTLFSHHFMENIRKIEQNRYDIYTDYKISVDIIFVLFNFPEHGHLID